MSQLCLLDAEERRTGCVTSGMCTEEALETKPNIIAAACPFCMTMMRDGVKNAEKEEEIQVHQQQTNKKT